MKQPRRSIEDVARANWSFSLTEARRIAECVGKPFGPLVGQLSPEILVEEYEEASPISELAWHLNRSAFEMRFNERRHTWPLKPEIAAKSDKIVKHCDGLLAELLTSSGELHEGLGPGALYAQAALEGYDQGSAAVANAIEGVRELRRWASATAQRIRHQGTDNSPRGRRADVAWNDMVARLAGIYQFMWGRNPGVSTDPFNQKPNGPFFRFVQAVADHLLPNTKTDEAIRRAIKRFA